MSYEGHYQILCEKGHYTKEDCNSFMGEGPWDEKDPINDWRCPFCGAKLLWWNGVDETNGVCEDKYDVDCSDFKKCIGCPNRIDGYVSLEIDSPAQIKKCPTCNQDKLVSRETYKIPTEGHFIERK